MCAGVSLPGRWLLQRAKRANLYPGVARTRCDSIFAAARSAARALASTATVGSEPSPGRSPLQLYISKADNNLTRSQTKIQKIL